jgi:hypothetical protein
MLLPLIISLGIGLAIGMLSTDMRWAKNAKEVRGIAFNGKLYKVITDDNYTDNFDEIANHESMRGEE